MKKETVLKILSWLPAIAMMVVIFLFSSQYSDDSAQVSLGILEWLEKVLHIPLNHNFIRKTAHAIEFCALGAAVEFAFFVTLKRVAPIATLVFSFLYAVSDEVHQIFVPGRAFMVKDMFVDLCGAAVGTLVVILIVWMAGLIKNRKSKKQTE